MVSAMARWQLLPPRQWLLAYLSAVQQQLLLRQYSLQDLSGTLWGLATLGVRPKTPWLDLAAAAAEQQMQGQAQAIMQLQRQQRVWQQQRTRDGVAQQKRKKANSASAAASTATTSSSSSSSNSSPLSLRPDVQEGSSPHHNSVVERLGPERQQKLQQYSTVPKQLAVLLWSLQQLQYSPTSPFWEQFWGLSVLLLPRQYNVRDLAMTLEAAVQQQQSPPQQWMQAALVAGASVHVRERQVFETASQKQQVQEQKQRRQQQRRQSGDGGSSSHPQADNQQQQQQQDHEFWAGLKLQRQQHFSRNVLRMLYGFARLGVQPGHKWCAGVLENAVRPVAQHLSPQVRPSMGGLGRCVVALGGRGELTCSVFAVVEVSWSCTQG